MRLVWLSWYITGILALLFLLSSLIFYGPGAERLGMVIQLIFASGTVAGIAVSLWLSRFPRDHWVHRSKPIGAVFIAAAVMVTLLAEQGTPEWFRFVVLITAIVMGTLLVILPR